MDDPRVLERGRTDPERPLAEPRPVSGRLPESTFLELDDEPWQRITAVDALPPFLMNIPTDTDLWMFLSSTAGLTAGRRDPDGALFPYETVDRLHDGPHHTGPVTLLRVRRGSAPASLWEPLAPADPLPRELERSLAKSLLGDRVLFEEVNSSLALAFRYRWAGSDETGWVRTATLTNLGHEPVSVSVLDGLRNLLPSGVALRLQQQSSCLVDAYKRADVDAATGLGTFALTSRISDRPEPGEELRATTVWCHGLPGARVSLSLDALRAFRLGEPMVPEGRSTGSRGHYLVGAELTLAPGARTSWHLAADTRRSHADIARLRARLLEPASLPNWIESALRRSSEGLRRIVASGDAYQVTGRAAASAHHLANVLYNSLRGGIFVDQHHIEGASFVSFVSLRSRAVAARHAGWLASLPEYLEAEELLRASTATGDADLRRLVLEHLPLYFGRRHGDPSRPWNRFSIVVRDAAGARALRHEGNWRDVFQNWEALTRSFPAFLPHVVARFLNASTVDGFNPYRITHEGVDWEVLDPHDPWSGIGYWGDHQVIYLLRLMESLHRHHPGVLEEWLGEEIFAYADVPYRLMTYAEIVSHPRHTIRFDGEREAAVAARVTAEGADGKLVHEPDGAVRHASLLEKLLVPALSKLSNLVPEGGIWMNTERPEWNDANNALAGSGVSVVTLAHLRRYLGFVEDLVESASAGGAPVSSEVVAWFRQVNGILSGHRDALATARCDDETRRRVLDELGLAFESYRSRAYVHGLGSKQSLEPGEVLEWCRVAREHVEHALRANRRDDGLYHSYHVLELDSESRAARLHPLALMLEGQVAILDSGVVGAREAAAMLEALFASALFRRDRDTFLLYPEHELPAFLGRNVIPEDAVAGVSLVAELLAAGDRTVLERDVSGMLRFHADFANAGDVQAALARLAEHPIWTGAVARDREAVIALFVEAFGHRTFTGRSSRMYAYEGLGCIYWHMVAKLLLAVQEIALRAFEAGEPADVRDTLARAYHRIRGGLGYEKSVRAFGAFPTDPYSHTPAKGGAQQPGMTGQVKEEILARFGEFGVHVRKGLVEFAPWLLDRAEFLTARERFQHVDRSGVTHSIDLEPGTLAFTYAQVPVIYLLTRGESWIEVTRQDGSVSKRSGDRLDPGESHSLLARDGQLARIEVGVPEKRLWSASERAS